MTRKLEIEYLLAELAAPVVKAERRGGLTVWHKRSADADDVANRLLVLRCYGGMGCQDCPVYYYLVRHVVNYSVIVTVGSVDLPNNSRLDHIPLPGVIAKFIRKFDSGSYDWLRKERVPAWGPGGLSAHLH
jgi:hypothetical protein